MTIKRVTAKSEGLLIHFGSEDSAHAVTRRTVRAMASALGLNENQTIHYALALLRDKLLFDAPVSTYEPDDGPLSPAQIRAIKDRIGQVNFNPTRSIRSRGEGLVDPE